MNYLYGDSLGGSVPLLVYIFLLSFHPWQGVNSTLQVLLQLIKVMMYGI